MLCVYGWMVVACKTQSILLFASKSFPFLVLFFLFFVVVFSKSQNVTVSGAMALKTLSQACYH